MSTSSNALLIATSPLLFSPIPPDATLISNGILMLISLITLYYIHIPNRAAPILRKNHRWIMSLVQLWNILTQSFMIWSDIYANQDAKTRVSLLILADACVSLLFFMISLTNYYTLTIFSVVSDFFTPGRLNVILIVIIVISTTLGAISLISSIIIQSQAITDPVTFLSFWSAANIATFILGFFTFAYDARQAVYLMLNLRAMASKRGRLAEEVSNKFTRFYKLVYVLIFFSVTAAILDFPNVIVLGSLLTLRNCSVGFLGIHTSCQLFLLLQLKDLVRYLNLNSINAVERKAKSRDYLPTIKMVVMQQREDQPLETIDSMVDHIKISGQNQRADNPSVLPIPGEGGEDGDGEGEGQIDQ